MNRIIFIILVINGTAPAQTGWFWQNPNPTGNDLNCVKFINSQTGFASGDRGTLIKTTDAGITWNRIYTNFFTNLNSLFFIDAITGFVGGMNGLMYKTTNGGNNWILQNTGFVDEIFSIQFVNSNTGYAGAAYGNILKTTNGGDKWSIINLNNPFFLKSLTFINENTGYCAGSQFVFKTTNGGANWIEQNVHPGVSIISMSFLNINSGYVAASDGKIFKTTNGGTNWSLTSTLTGFTLTSIYFLNEGHGYVSANTDSSFVLHKTTNGGNNWISLVNPYVHNMLKANSVWMIDSVNIIVTGSNGVTARSDGINTVVNNQTFTQLNSLFFSNENTGYCVGNLDFNYQEKRFEGKLLKTTDEGLHWGSLPQNIQYDFNDIYFIDENRGLMLGDSSGYSKIFKTTNGGNNWTASYHKNFFLRRFFFIDQNVGFAGGSRIFDGIILKTTNGGDNWTETVFPGSNTILSIHFPNELTGYASTQSDKFFKTTDGGLNWTSRTLSYLLPAVFFINPNTGFLSNFSGGIIKTTNGGNIWFNVLVGNSSMINSIYFIDNITGYCAGEDGKILKSTNSGSNWVYLNSNTENLLSSIRFIDNYVGYSCGANGTLIKTTDGGATIGIVDQNSLVRKDFHLHQNYPNPFNPKTIISYQLPASRGESMFNFVTLRVYDILGNEVETLVNEKQNAGSYEVEFDAGDLPSGIYFYSITTKNFSETKRMVFLK